MFKYEVFGSEQAPLAEYEWRYIRVRLAEMFGWHLDYIDTLNYQDVNDIFSVKDARQAAKAARQE